MRRGDSVRSERRTAPRDLDTPVGSTCAAPDSEYLCSCHRSEVSDESEIDIMTELTVNPLPAFNVDDDGNWAALALCVLDIETRACIYCGKRAIWDTYTEYTDHFWGFEYEGDSWHAPDDEADFDRVSSLCLATADENADDSAVAR